MAIKHIATFNYVQGIEPTMRGLVLSIFMSLLFIILIVQLSGGSSVTISGNGSSGNGLVPFINTARPPTYSPLDPSQYQTPIPPTIPDQGKSDSSKSNLNSNGTINESDQAPIGFTMISMVKGTSGNDILSGFSEWRSIDDGMGQKTKQASSASEGTLKESKAIFFTTSDSTSTTANSSRSAILFNDQIEFNGTAYHDRAIFLNNGERLRNSFESASITKSSTYRGMFDSLDQNEDELTTKSHINTSTRYRLSTRNVGVIKFDRMTKPDGLAKTPEEEISVEYIGKFAFDMNINNSQSWVYSGESDDWLPCCSYDGNSTLPTYDEISSKWLGPSATEVFDCTCPNLQSKTS